MRFQTWRRLGRVFVAAGEELWRISHASNPTPLVLSGKRVRVYFSPRDADNRSSIAAIDLELEDQRFAVVSSVHGPLLSPGARGAFDDSGVSVGCAIEFGGRTRIWYLGWSLGVTVPFRNFIGLAEGPLDGPMRRVSPVPVLDRSIADPFTLGYPWVIREASGLRLWYGSHLEWGDTGLAMRHAIKHASSSDGIAWIRDGNPVLAPAGGAEFALSRPCVVRDADRYRLWFCRRFTNYRLGYAESSDGYVWRRRDKQLRFVGPKGCWETASMAYPTVFDCGGRRYMLYNGDGYGRTGFGLAILEDDGG